MVVRFSPELLPLLDRCDLQQLSAEVLQGLIPIIGQLGKPGVDFLRHPHDDLQPRTSHGTTSDTILPYWRPRRESNPSSGLERPMS